MRRSRRRCFFFLTETCFAGHYKEEGFAWIPQVFSNQFTPSGTVAEHLRSLKSQIEECLDDNPLFINGHTGSDTWSYTQAEDFYGAALEMEAELGIPSPMRRIDCATFLIRGTRSGSCGDSLP